VAHGAAAVDFEFEILETEALHPLHIKHVV